MLTFLLQCKVRKRTTSCTLHRQCLVDPRVRGDAESTATSFTWSVWRRQMELRAIHYCILENSGDTSYLSMHRLLYLCQPRLKHQMMCQAYRRQHVTWRLQLWRYCKVGESEGTKLAYSNDLTPPEALTFTFLKATARYISSTSSTVAPPPLNPVLVLT